MQYTDYYDGKILTCPNCASKTSGLEHGKEQMCVCGVTMIRYGNDLRWSIKDNDMRNLCISCGGRNASQFDKLMDEVGVTIDEDAVTYELHGVPDKITGTYEWTNNIESIYEMRGEETARPDEVVFTDKTYRSTVVRTTDRAMEDILVLGALTSGKYCSIQLNRAGQFRLRCTLLHAENKEWSKPLVSEMWQTHNINGVVSISTREELIDSFLRHD